MSPWLPAFWLMQVAAYAGFKYGSLGDRRQWFQGFIGGNLVGMTSIYPLMQVYQQMAANPNLAAVVTTVGSAIGCQLVLAVLFRSRLAWSQWLGIALTLGGTVLATLGTGSL